MVLLKKNLEKNLKKKFNSLALKKGLGMPFSTSKGNVIYYPFKKSFTKVPAMPIEGFNNETFLKDYLKVYKEYGDLSGTSNLEKVALRFLSSGMSFSTATNHHCFNYAMASRDFYKGDTGSYLFEMDRAACSFSEIVRNNLAEFEPEIEGPFVSISLYYSLYNEVDKVEGSSKRLDVLTKVHFSKLKRFYSEQAKAFIDPASERLLYEAMLLNESSSLFHITAFDYKVDIEP